MDLKPEQNELFRKMMMHEKASLASVFSFVITTPPPFTLTSEDIIKHLTISDMIFRKCPKHEIEAKQKELGLN
jgi:hypothetical protein